GGRMRSFAATRASVSASHPLSSAIFAAARTTASLLIPTRAAILSLLHEAYNCGRDEIGILDVRVMPGALDHQFFSVKMNRHPIGFGGGIVEIRVARTHHDQYRGVNLGNPCFARGLGREDHRLGCLDSSGLFEIGDQSLAI